MTGWHPILRSAPRSRITGRPFRFTTSITWQRPRASQCHVNPNYKNAYIESFNLNLQQALPWDMVASLYYDGSVGRHLLIRTNENQATGPAAPASVPDSLSHQPHRSRCGHRLQHRRSNSILSNYNGLWAVLSKNMSHGLEFSMNYEWTKSMDINSLGSQGGSRCRTATTPAKTTACRTSTCAITSPGQQSTTCPSRATAGLGLSACDNHPVPDRQSCQHPGRQLKLQRRNRPCSSQPGWLDHQA